MDTPILDFLRGYEIEGMSRFHMPGHKGTGPLGCEAWDLTEIKGADSLYEADGIIAQSEANAARLFGARRTFYSTEGSSQCIRAMLALALENRPAGTAPVVLAGRNVHKAFLYAAALLDLEVEWLWSEEKSRSVCSCPITVQGLEKALTAMEQPPMAVYITSPDYLGNIADVSALAQVAHRHGSLLLVDNAHGAYLHFLEKPCHPLDLGADLCCDSAHKTLPVLTGGSYLHISKTAPEGIEDGGRTALSLFGSTSPSYLILASLDACNAWLSGDGPSRIRDAARALDTMNEELTGRSWTLAGNEPLKLTINAAASGWAGTELADLLRVGGVECEYADPDHVVLMASGNTTEEDFQKVADALSIAKPKSTGACSALTIPRGERVLSIRQAILGPKETLTVEDALGRVLAAPSVSCPPAVPILVCGERITAEAVAAFRYYGHKTCLVVKE